MRYIVLVSTELSFVTVFTAETRKIWISCKSSFFICETN